MGLEVGTLKMLRRLLGPVNFSADTVGICILNKGSPECDPCPTF